MLSARPLAPSGPALIVHGAGDLRLEDVPTARPLPDETVVEIAYGGICGSDLHYWRHGAANPSSRHPWS